MNLVYVSVVESITRKHLKNLRHAFCLLFFLSVLTNADVENNEHDTDRV